MSLSHRITLGTDRLELADVKDFLLGSYENKGIQWASGVEERVKASQAEVLKHLENGTPIYGVTTGFGDSASRMIPREQSETLQANLVSYLLCGTGPLLPKRARQATLLFRTQSLARGFSGVSFELLQRMALYIENQWTPVIPREGSLGASGDLIPLAYLAEALQGHGEIETEEGIFPTAQILEQNELNPYVLKAKEGLALVNGTSAMAGLTFYNLHIARFLCHLQALNTAWLCLALKGRVDSFSPLVNDLAKTFEGQSRFAATVSTLLNEEDYHSPSLEELQITNGQFEQVIQDKYSLRCSPQIMGPVLETLWLAEEWLTKEASGTSDNPLFAKDQQLAKGGNFYGGYMSQAMDYMKISLGHVADMMDRQFMSLIDEKSNRGLPPNLSAWDQIPALERHLHHGLKGLNQAMSALASEVLAKTNPNGVYSRSSEAHNQDKVSLGMSAAVQCLDLFDHLYTMNTIHLIGLAQALDLRGIELKGEISTQVYHHVRQLVPKVEKDKPLHKEIQMLAESLKLETWKTGGWIDGSFI